MGKAYTSKKFQRTLFPQQHQFIIGRIQGQSYLSSLFVGLTAPVINLPLMLWQGVIKPPIRGLFFIVSFFIMGAIAGVMGRANGLVVDMPKVNITVTDGSEEES